MKSIFLVIFTFISIFTIAQYKINGVVLDNSTQKPIEGVSLFLSRTTIGAASNIKGEFQLDHLKPGTYELVATSLNYENYIF